MAQPKYRPRPCYSIKKSVDGHYYFELFSRRGGILHTGQQLPYVRHVLADIKAFRKDAASEDVYMDFKDEE